MTIIEEAIELDRTPHHPPRHVPPRWPLIAAIAVVLVAITAVVLVVRGADDSTPTDPTPVTATSTRDDTVLPGCNLGAGRCDDESQITNHVPTAAPRSRDDIVRDLVDRGVVPGASLSDGTQVS